MKTWHYTTRENWKHIQKKGLVPQLVTNPDIYVPTKWPNITPPKELVGTWLWSRKPVGKNHMGNIIRCVAKHNTVHVALLEVDITNDEVVHYGAQRVVFTHTGNIEKFVYHRNFPALIANKRIAPEKIRCVGEYDVLDLLTAVDKEDTNSYTSPADTLRVISLQKTSSVA